jgi:UPF0271 protein
LAKEQVADHVRRMVERAKVKTPEGREIAIKAETFCIHGDNPDALEILERLHKEFEV